MTQRNNHLFQLLFEYGIKSTFASPDEFANAKEYFGRVHFHSFSIWIILLRQKTHIYTRANLAFAIWFSRCICTLCCRWFDWHLLHIYIYMYVRIYSPSHRFLPTWSIINHHCQPRPALRDGSSSSIRTFAATGFIIASSTCRCFL